MEDKFDTEKFELTEEGKKVIREFKKENPDLYFLLNAEVLTKFIEMAKEDLDKKDYERVMKCLAFGV